MGRTAPPDWHAPFTELNGNGMLDREPPDHTRLRRLVLEAFTPRTVENAARPGPGDGGRAHRRTLRPRRRRPHRGLIEPLPVTVIAELLGIPEADRHLLRPWSRDICLMFELDPPEASARRRSRPASRSVPTSRPPARAARHAWRRPHQRPGRGRRRRRPADGGRADRDLRAAAQRRARGVRQRGRRTAGGRSSATPASWPRCATTPPSPPTAVDELLRFDTPLPLFERWVLEDIEVAGVPDATRRGGRPAVRVGQPRSRAFADPDQLDLGRTRTRTSRSARGSTTAWARRWPGWSCRSRSRACCAGRPGLELRRGAGVEADVRAARARGRCGSRREWRAEPPPLRRPRRLVHDRHGASTSGRAVPGPARAALGARAGRSTLVANLGVNGYTSSDLIRDELPALDGLRPGVRDAAHRRRTTSSRACRRNATRRTSSRILDALLAPARRIGSSPSPSLTTRSPRRRRLRRPAPSATTAIVAHNAIMRVCAEDRGIALRRHLRHLARAAADRSLVAADGLHPSGAQYAPLGRADRAGRAADLARAPELRLVRAPDLAPATQIPAPFARGAPATPHGASPCGCRRAIGRPRTSCGARRPRARTRPCS